MRSKAWFVSTMMLGSGLLAGCNLSQENPTSPAVALPDGSVALTSRDAPASGTKVAMCHRREDATYHRLDVPSPAAPAHRAHGDAAVGEAVPGPSYWCSTKPVHRLRRPSLSPQASGSST